MKPKKVPREKIQQKNIETHNWMYSNEEII